MENKIDFVILWVDGSDEAWLDERRKYSGDENTGSKSRYRDWNNLQYWFRGVEKLCPLGEPDLFRYLGTYSILAESFSSQA